MCFISQATPKVSKPKKLPVVEKSYVVMITGKADRTLLTKEILDFCGVLPIYNTKRYPDTSTKSGVAGNEENNYHNYALYSKIDEDLSTHYRN